MSMTSFVPDTVRKLSCQIRKISSIRCYYCYLNQQVTQTLVSSLVLLRLDYFHSLLTGLSNDALQVFQVIQNNAALLITRIKRSQHITPSLKSLHWLPVKYCIMYKMCTLCYKCLNGMAPVYLSSALTVYTPARQL